MKFHGENAKRFKNWAPTTWRRRLHSSQNTRHYSTKYHNNPGTNPYTTLPMNHLTQGKQKFLRDRIPAHKNREQKKYLATERNYCVGGPSLVASPSCTALVRLCTHPHRLRPTRWNTIMSPNAHFISRYKLQLPLCEWETQSHSINRSTQL